MADEKRNLRQLDGLGDYRTWRDVNINRVYSVPIVNFWMPVLMVVSEILNILRTTWSDMCTYQKRETSQVSIVDACYWLKGDNFHSSWLSLERIRIGMSGTSVFRSRRTWLAFGNCQSHAEAAELRVHFQILYTLKDLGTESSTWDSGFIVIRSKLGRTKGRSDHDSVEKDSKKAHNLIWFPAFADDNLKKNGRMCSSSLGSQPWTSSLPPIKYRHALTQKYHQCSPIGVDVTSTLEQYLARTHFSYAFFNPCSEVRMNLPLRRDQVE